MTATLAPWTVLSSREVYAAEPWLKVHLDTVELPDGRRVEFHQVEVRDFALIVPQTEDGRFVLLRQYKHGARRVNVSFPAGGIEPGEAPLECAKRELLEETGYAAEEWHACGGYVQMGNLRGSTGYLFLARGCRKVAEPDSGDLEEMRVEVMDRAALLAAMAAGDFAIMAQVAALLLALEPDIARTMGQGAERQR